MAASKKRVVAKKRAAPAGVGVAEFTAVLEDIRAQNKVFGEALQGVREGLGREMEEVRGELRHLDARMTAGFAQIDGRFEQVEGRFEQMDRRFERVEGDIVLLKAATLENTREIKDLKVTVTRIEAKLDAKVDRGEVGEIVEQTVERALARR